ncbi:MAG: hypothetical protein MH472_07510 [Bacteroidia bacterium]|nr:hypothetical protein [Bacteroidia bacterium]
MESKSSKNALFKYYKDYSSEGVVSLETQLKKLLAIPLPTNENTLKNYHDTLLFIQAYPANSAIFELAQQLMHKLVQTVKKEQKRKVNFLYNSGITGSLVCAQFGLWLNQYLLEQNLDKLYVESVAADEADLVNTLTYTLDSFEQETLMGEHVYFADWKKKYVGSSKDRGDLLRYIVTASLQVSGSISQRENKFAQLQLYTSFLLQESLLGISLGRSVYANIFYHPNGLSKKIRLEDVLKLGKPKERKLSLPDKEYLVRLARGTMASLLRETDTYTYAQTKETELFTMGDGIQIALYYMIPEQKFTWQSYIGFLVFKNAVPMAYGGCWLLNKQAAFGVNVLPPFRGGESTKILAQLFRLYHFRFDVNQFTVDPYQIGKGNSEAIESGAFWFYYKLGFKPCNPTLAELAEKEFIKLSANKNYRTKSEILQKLVSDDIVWHIGLNQEKLVSVQKIVDTLTKHVCEKFGANRLAAQKASAVKLEQVLKQKLKSSSFVNRMLISFDALGVFEKLTEKEIRDLYEAYHKKSDSEALAFQEIQLLKRFWRLVQS